MRSNTVRAKTKDKSGLKPILILNAVEQASTEAEHISSRVADAQKETDTRVLHAYGSIVSMSVAYYDHASIDAARGANLLVEKLQEPILDNDHKHVSVLICCLDELDESDIYEDTTWIIPVPSQTCAWLMNRL